MTIYIPKTEPLTLTAGDAKGQRLGVPELIRWFVDTDKQFNTTGPGIRAAARLEQALQDCDALHFVAVEDHRDHELLKKVAAEPSQGYPVIPSRRILPALDAIEQASTKKPSVPDWWGDAEPAAKPKPKRRAPRRRK